MIFPDFLFKLKDDHCLNDKGEKCNGNIKTCKVVSAILNSSFSDQSWCPRCDGYEKFRYPKFTKKKSKDGVVIKVPDGEGIMYHSGLLILIDSKGLKPMVWRCPCHAGDQYQHIKKYNPNLWDDNRCFYKIHEDFIKWWDSLTDKIQAKAVKNFKTMGESIKNLQVVETQ